MKTQELFVCWLADEPANTEKIKAYSHEGAAMCLFDEYHDPCEDGEECIVTVRRFGETETRTFRVRADSEFGGAVEVIWDQGEKS
jgi:hypothetical protein